MTLEFDDDFLKFKSCNAHPSKNNSSIIRVSIPINNKLICVCRLKFYLYFVGFPATFQITNTFGSIRRLTFDYRCICIKWGWHYCNI